MSDAPAEFDDVLSSWTPVPERVTGELAAWPAEALAALLGSSLPEDGTLPPLWYEIYLRSARPVAALGADGHPREAALVPPLAHRRRMFGGGRITVETPLCVGDTVTRTSSVSDLRVRNGRTGWLLLLTELHEFSVDGELRVREERDVVYRRPEDVVRTRDGAGRCGPDTAGDAASPQTGPAAGGTDFALDPDERLLFCFSALTYNPHRIHYDRDYTRQVEGHRDLLVHGPLLAIGAIEAARRVASRAIRSVNYRLVAPSHPGSPVTFPVRHDDGTVTVTGLQDGQAKVEARIAWT